MAGVPAWQRADTVDRSQFLGGGGKIPEPQRRVPAGNYVAGQPARTRTYQPTSRDNAGSRNQAALSRRQPPADRLQRVTRAAAREQPGPLRSGAYGAVASREAEQQRPPRSGYPAASSRTDGRARDAAVAGLRAWEKPEREEVVEGRRAATLESNRRSGRELSDAEYAALTPSQKAAVQFNTGLLAADGDKERTQNLLTTLGITPRDDAELDSFLQLDQLIEDKVVDGLASLRTRRTDAVSGAPRPEGGSRLVSAASVALADALESGATGLGGQRSQAAGFGGGPRDEVVQRAYIGMMDADAGFGPDDVRAGIAEMNAAFGTDVTWEEVRAFARTNLVEVPEFRVAGGGQRRVPTPVDFATGEAINPRDAAEVVRIFGL